MRSVENDPYYKSKIKIISSFLLLAPPGELVEVYNDLRHLVNDEIFLQNEIVPYFIQYNKEKLIPAILSKEAKTLITRYNELDSMTYFDPRTKQCFSFNHFNHQVLEIKGNNNILSSFGENRENLEKLIDHYVKDRYSENAIGSVFEVKTAKYDEKIIVCIEAHKYNPKNFWNGRWCSEWKWNVKKKRVKGKVTLHVHYYEDGNVQLLSSKSIIEKEIASFQLFFDTIKKSEDEYQEGINENYSSMSETTFKALRRALPITKAKVDWLKIASYKVGREILK